MTIGSAGSSVLSNCPRDCYDGCGLLIEKRAD